MKTVQNKLPTVTIGIPAYNEEANIGNLLESIIRQDRKRYILEKIIVVSDGSSDLTQDIVAKYARKNSSITLIADGRRIGKAKRLMQLYKVNTSDYFLQIDADLVPANKTVLDDLIKGFVDEKIAVVSGDIKPVQPQTYIEYLFYIWFKLWCDVKKYVKDQNIIRNIHSGIIVLRKDFAKKIILVPRISSDGQYIFCFTKQQKLLFKYMGSAEVYFRLPANIHDYLLQINRTTDEKQKLAAFFGDWIYDLFKIPLGAKLKALFKHFLMRPIDTLLASSLFLILRFMPQTDTQKIQDGKWQMVKSTKKL